MFTSDAYNKHHKAGNGTLVENWWEERTMQEMTGHGRSEYRPHIQKKHGELPPQHWDDNSSTRIHGEKQDEFYSTYK